MMIKTLTNPTGFAAILLAAGLFAGPFFGAGNAVAATDESGTETEGSASPDSNPFLDLMSVDGNRADADEHFNNGKWTLVMLWATNCHVCHEQKPMTAVLPNVYTWGPFYLTG